MDLITEFRFRNGLEMCQNLLKTFDMFRMTEKDSPKSRERRVREKVKKITIQGLIAETILAFEDKIRIFEMFLNFTIKFRKL